jgi:hypothetical protein
MAGYASPTGAATTVDMETNAFIHKLVLECTVSTAVGNGRYIQLAWRSFACSGPALAATILCVSTVLSRLERKRSPDR